MSDFYIGRWHSPEGNVIVIVKRGTSNIHCVLQDLPVVRMVTLPKEAERNITRMDYPLKRAVRQYLAFGRKYDITKGAKTLLQEALEAQ